MFDIVKKIIDNHDPYKLLARGAPKDEYNSESDMIASLINNDDDINKIVAIISAVFSHSFGCDFPKEISIKMANEIKLSVEI